MTKEEAKVEEARKAEINKTAKDFCKALQKLLAPYEAGENNTPYDELPLEEKAQRIRNLVKDVFAQQEQEQEQE